MADRYEIKGKLGQGGFGQVYLAQDLVLSREVAIKRLLPPEESSSAEIGNATFSREAMTLAALQHPHIVEIYDFAQDEDGWFVVMERLNGKCLKDTVAQGNMSWEDFLKIVRESLDGISAAHAKGILHRDLKPENLYLHTKPTGGWSLKILDFGLAKQSMRASKQTLDQKGNIFGSVRFMAPEQFLRKPIDHRTDIYSLGCVFYCVLTGEFAFDGRSMAILMDAHLKHQVRDVRDFQPDVPAPVAAWMMRMIALDPANRPSSALVALEEFEAALEGIMPPDGTSAPVPSASSAIPKGVQPSTSSATVALPPISQRVPGVAHRPTASVPVPPRARPSTQSSAVRLTSSVAVGTPVTPVAPAPRSKAGLFWTLGICGALVVGVGAYLATRGTKSDTSSVTAGAPSKTPAPISNPGLFWIWPAGEFAVNGGVVKTQFDVPGKVKSAHLIAATDDASNVFINGQKALSVPHWNRAEQIDVTNLIHPGKNEFRAEVVNNISYYGFVAKLVMTMADGKQHTLLTDSTWEGALPDSNEFKPVAVVQPYDIGKWNTATFINLDWDDHPLPLDDRLAWRICGNLGWWDGWDGKLWKNFASEHKRVRAWENLAPRSRGAFLTQSVRDLSKGAQSCVTVGEFNHSVSYAYFQPGESISQTLGKDQAKYAPGVAPAINGGGAGVTVVSVFRVGGKPNELDMRLFGLTSTSQPGSKLGLLFNSKDGHYWMHAENGKGKIEVSLKAPDLTGQKWCVALGLWDSTKGTVSLRVRTAKGNVVSASDQHLAPGLGPLDSLQIGTPPDVKKDIAPSEGAPLQADIAEFAIYDGALDKANQDKVVNLLWDYYFKKQH